jgi:hypothetical protein
MVSDMKSYIINYVLWYTNDKIIGGLLCSDMIL